MTAVKATLKIVLQANDVVVAEVEDAALWQRVLATINAGARGTGNAGVADAGTDGLVAPPMPDLMAPDAAVPPSPNDAVGRLANRLGVARELVLGACSPESTAPFMHLDTHCWEEMKRQVPARGQGSVSPIGLAATLLALWFREANLGNPTQAQAQAVLGTINLRDANPTRGIGAAEWLQARSGGVVVLNPANISKATALMKAFCSRKWGESAAS